MIKKIVLVSVLSASVVLSACSSSDDNAAVMDTMELDVIGDSAFVSNAFEDAGFTGGVQTIFFASEPVVVSEADVEFPYFIGFYDIDISDNALTMTLVDNSSASVLLYPEGTFDRYYVGFSDNSITSVSLNGTEGLNANASVSVLDDNFELSRQDLFQTGVEMPISFPNGGILIELGAGTDITELNQMLKLTFN